MLFRSEQCKDKKLASLSIPRRYARLSRHPSRSGCRRSRRSSGISCSAIFSNLSDLLPSSRPGFCIRSTGCIVDCRGVWARAFEFSLMPGCWIARELIRSLCEVQSRAWLVEPTAKTIKTGQAGDQKDHEDCRDYVRRVTLLRNQPQSLVRPKD